MHRPIAQVCFLTVLLTAAPASAQMDPPLGQFNILRYAPAPGPSNYLQVDGAVVRGEAEPSFGLQFDYAHEPLTLYSARCDSDGNHCETTGTESRIVGYTAAAHVWGSLALFHRLQVSLIVPVALMEGSSFNDPRARGEPVVFLSGGTTFSVGDPRLHLKAGVFEDTASGFRLAASGWVSAPLAHQIAGARQLGRFLGDEQPSFGVQAIAELVRSGFHLTANVGYLWRDGDQLFSTVAGQQMTYAVGVGWEVTPLAYVFGEVVGATSFRADVDENPLEGRIGGRLRIDDVTIDLGGGVGILAGSGVPLFRVLGGFAFAPVRSDTDGDRIGDSSDVCPTEPEDVDGFEDEDGCPEPDNDRDGVPDGEDTCPEDAEDLDGELDQDGCPDVDNDGDGIYDGYDSCPEQPEDVDGDRDEDGCPDHDRDRDNIDDERDQCPEQPEDTDGFGDEDGCPETDFDGDGIEDDRDECPDQAEDADGFEDENGCPEDAGPPPPPSETRPTGTRRRGR
jgi:hypothetical protein